MSYEIINKIRGSSIIRIVDSGVVSINLSELAAGSPNTENVYAASISSAYWSTNGAGAIVVTRQNAGSPANTVASFYGSGFWPAESPGLANSATGNLTITVSGGAVGSLLLVVKKQANYNVDTQDL